MSRALNGMDRRTWLFGALAASTLPGWLSAHAQDETPRVARAATRTQSTAVSVDDALATLAQLRANLAEVKDYQCLFVKRERIAGVLGDAEHLTMKLRHKPFSVYMRFEGPKSLAGREVIYVAGRNDGKLLAHATGLQRLAGTLSLDPQSSLAMKGNLHPITDSGMLHLTEEIEAVCQRSRRADVTIERIAGGKVDGRPCTCLQIRQDSRRPEVPYHVVRLFIDDELELPVRSEAYGFPARDGESPALIAEYTFLRLKTNVGLRDMDFDTRNPAYEFKR